MWWYGAGSGRYSWRHILSREKYYPHLARKANLGRYSVEILTGQYSLSHTRGNKEFPLVIQVNHCRTAWKLVRWLDRQAKCALMIIRRRLRGNLLEVPDAVHTCTSKPHTPAQGQGGVRG